MAVDWPAPGDSCEQLRAKLANAEAALASAQADRDRLYPKLQDELDREVEEALAQYERTKHPDMMPPLFDPVSAVDHKVMDDETDVDVRLMDDIFNLHPVIDSLRAAIATTCAEEFFTSEVAPPPFDLTQDLTPDLHVDEAPVGSWTHLTGAETPPVDSSANRWVHLTGDAPKASPTQADRWVHLTTLDDATSSADSPAPPVPLAKPATPFSTQKVAIGLAALLVLIGFGAFATYTGLHRSTASRPTPAVAQPYTIDAKGVVLTVPDLPAGYVANPLGGDNPCNVPDTGCNSSNAFFVNFRRALGANPGGFYQTGPIGTHFGVSSEAIVFDSTAAAQSFFKTWVANGCGSISAPTLGDKSHADECLSSVQGNAVDFIEFGWLNRNIFSSVDMSGPPNSFTVDGVTSLAVKQQNRFLALL